MSVTIAPATGAPATPAPAPALRRNLLTAAAVLAVVVMVAVALARVHVPLRPRTFCVLRALTGIPCPACGGTTAVVDLGHGDLRGALAASPLAVAAAVWLPAARAVPRLRSLPGSPATRWRLIVLLLAASELWELVRFGIL